ncbi:hypothetical protein [Roseisolibacter agri]|nr:hypothetical protein [Roseisolibacter agri]
MSARSASGEAALAPPRDARRAQLVDDLRRRGVRGGLIPQHRAMIRLRLTPTIAFELLLVPALVAGAVLLLFPELLALWQDFFRFGTRALGLPGQVETSVVTLFGGLTVALPQFTIEAAWPTRMQLLGHAGLVVGIALMSFALPRRLYPAALLLRALAILHATSVTFFLLGTRPFPYPLAQYATDFLLCGLVVLTVAPFLLGLTFFIFGVPLVEKLLLSVLLLAHLAVLLPLQLMLHVYIAARASLVMLPLLFIAFGLLLDVTVFVALYGWGMSWLSSAERRRGPRGGRVLLGRQVQP